MESSSTLDELSRVKAPFVRHLAKLPDEGNFNSRKLIAQAPEALVNPKVLRDSNPGQGDCSHQRISHYQYLTPPPRESRADILFTSIL